MSAPAPRPLRIWELLAALVRGGVDFLVIGGVAVGAHGFERGTKDVDVVPQPQDSNLDRLLRVLEELEAAPVDLGDLRADELSVQWSRAALAHGGNWFLDTRFGRLDVMQFVEGVLETAEDYAGLAARALVLDTPVGAVRFAGFDDLLRMKLAAGREQDLIDVRALREARGELGE